MYIYLRISNVHIALVLPTFKCASLNRDLCHVITGYITEEFQGIGFASRSRKERSL